MKTIKFFTLGVVAILALTSQGQTFKPSGWFRGGPSLTEITNSNVNITLASPSFGGGGIKPNGIQAGNPPVVANETTPEIQALARGLENDPARIFGYVHDHIRHVLYYGAKKGAQLTLLERSGNDFDQCTLLVTLLQAAGYTNGPGYDHGVGYQYAVVKMPYDSPDHNDLHHWLALSLLNTNWANTTNYLENLLAQRGYPIEQYSVITGTTPGFSWFTYSDTNTFAFQHVWVTLTVGTNTYYLDPAFKINEPVTNIVNLASAIGFNSNLLWSVAGGTSDTNHVQGLAEAALRGQLQTYNSNLLATLQSSYPNASVQQVMGGQQIMPWTNALSQTNLFVTDTQGGLYPSLSWSNVPPAFMAQFQIQLSDNVSFSFITNWYYPSLKGGRLSITCDSNGIARAWLEDSLLGSITNVHTASAFTAELTLRHPSWAWDTNLNIPQDSSVYPYNQGMFPNAGFDSISDVYPNWTNASYALNYTFEPDVKWLNERSQKLDTYRQQGYADTSPQVVTESLNIMGLSWMIQSEQMEGMIDQQLNLLPEYLERFGLVGQESGAGYFVDFFYQYNRSYPNSGSNPTDLQNRNRAFDLDGYFASSMEHGIIEQFQTGSLVGASTIKVLQLANTNNQAIYLANSGNWSIVETNLTNYTPTELSGFSSALVPGVSLLLPANGAVQVGSWTGYGFIEQQIAGTSESIGFQIDGHYGGFTSDPSSVISTIAPIIAAIIGFDQPSFANRTPFATIPTSAGDPVNMSDAAFHINTTDLSLGHPEPLGLTLGRYYTPSRQHLNLASMANGWINSYYFNLAEVSAPVACLGGTTPAQMSPMLTAVYTALNIYNTPPDPKNWMVTALIAKWGIDQTINTAVSVELGNDTAEFVRQPDGSFTPPANCTMTLTKGSTYQLQERHGNTFNFNSSKQLAVITNQSGDSLSLTYTSGQLTQASDWKGRTLTFSYSGSPSRLNSVTDSSGRSVSYGYTTSADGNLDLTSVTDPEGKTSTYLYDTNHQIVATYDALGRLVVTNVYDTLGHVTTQYTQGDPNKTWQIYWSEWEAVSQDPAGNKQRYFYDDMTRLIGQQDPLGNTSQLIYDGQNHVVTTISPLNETNQFIYDGNNNLTNSIDPLGFFSQFVYDNQNNLVHSIDARTNISNFGYDSKFRLTGSTNGAGDWVTFTYNSDGTMASKVDPGGTTSYGYDAYGQLNSVTYPAGLGGEIFVNSSLGDVTSHTDANSNTTTFNYNNRRQLTNSVAPGMTNSVAYDAVGNAISAKDARGSITTNNWSVTRHLLSITLPPTPAGTATITNGYDNRDWLVETVNPLFQATLYTNDAAQRLISMTDPLLRTTTLSYDNDGRNITFTNAALNGTLQKFDARGSLTMVSDPAGRIVKRAYDSAGNQITLTNRNGKKWQFQFDAANQLTNTITPLSRSMSQMFNNRGLLASSKDPASQTQTFTYDPLGRLTNRTDNVGTTTYRYDASSNPTNVTENGLSNSWTYDAYNRLSSCRDVYGDLMQYQYDLNGNLTNLVYPGGRNVYYAYDGLNHMTNVTDWSGRKTILTYDLVGRLTSITRPNGTQRIIGYDVAGQTTNITEKAANGNIIDYYKLGWDNAARMVTEFGAPLPHTSTVPARSMSFDDDNRLTAIDGSTLVNDVDGNMTSGPLTNDTLFTYTYDARNRLLNAGGVTNAYDPTGNRIGQTFGTNSVAYVINPNSKLSQVLMRIKNGVTNYYVYGAGLLYQVTESATATNMLTYHYDYRGSTVALTDATGNNVTDRIEYSAYATTAYRTGTNDTPFLFNGRYGVMTDPNGLLNMRARFYNPYICRFINADPSGFAGGLNFYAYANENPVGYLDPFGLSAWYDSWGNGVGQVAANAQSFLNNNLPWQIAGYADTQISIVAGFLSSPQALGHVGEGSGTFSANPTLANSAGVFSDISIIAGTIAGGVSPIAEFNSPLGYGNVVYRYASEDEIDAMNEANGGNYILNQKASGVSKDVFVTPEDPLSSISQAVDTYQLDGSQSYVIAGDASKTAFNYGGNVEGGSGIEMTTSEQIPVISVNRIGYNLQYGTAASALSWFGGTVSVYSSTGK
jgi:RHS repeat-associated protein